MRKACQKLTCLILSAMMICMAAIEAKAFNGFLPVRTYDGRVYEARPSSETTTILLIGYDHAAQGEVEELHGYSSGGQADFLLLVVLDHRFDRIHMLQIDRDTMTRVRVTDANGRQHDRSNLQICLAHAYGNTREQNNANTVLAVETLLGIEAEDDGAQIDWYMAMDISGISRLNDLMGGVRITFTEDMTDIDPAMKAGVTLTLTGDQAEAFCRARTGVGDQTNVSRMGRQRQYLSAAGAQLMQLLRQNVNNGTRILDGMGVIYDQSAADAFGFGASASATAVGDAQGHWLMTDALKKRIVNDMALAAGYELMEPDTLPGVHSRGSNGYVCFEPEAGSAIEWALDVLYVCED